MKTVSKFIRENSKRVLAVILLFNVLLMSIPVAVMPFVLAEEADSEYICGLVEHTHSGDCYSEELVCGLEEVEQFAVHTHTEACSGSVLTCTVAEGEEHSHTDECYTAGYICGLDGAMVSLGTHAHTEECYAPVCGETAHTHTAECKAAAVAVTAVEEDGEKSLARAGGSELSVTGVWDVGDAEQGHENIPFDASADTIATISHDANHASEQVNVRISVVFPENATDGQLAITLKPGLRWLVNGETTIPKTALDSVSSLQNQTSFPRHPDGTSPINLGDGTYTYKFKDGVKSVDIDIVVEKIFWTNYPSITDAITAVASCTQEGSEVSAESSLTTLQPQQFNLGRNRSSLDVRTKAGVETRVRNGLMYTSSLTSAVEENRYRIYEYIQFTLNVPAEVIYGGIDTGDSAETSANRYWQLIDTSEPLSDGTINYTFRIEGISADAYYYTHQFTSSHLWTFPVSMIPEGSNSCRVKIKTTDFFWKFYGDNVERKYAENEVGTANITVVHPNVRDENTEVRGVRPNQSYSYIDYQPDAYDAIYRLSCWAIRNTGADPSVPKVVEFTFDTEKIGVTGLDLLTPRNHKVTTVWYKTKDSTEWQEKTLNLSITQNQSAGYMAHTLVRNIDLGLSADTYLTAFKYELDYINDNGTPNDTSDDFHYGIPATTTTNGYGSQQAPIIGVVKPAFVNDPTVAAVSIVTVYDKVADGEEATTQPKSADIISTLAGTNDKLKNFLYAKSDDKIEVEAGETLTFSYDIISYWSSTSSRPYIVGFHQCPVIYIRDETGGAGLTNVKLINGLGVDLLTKYAGLIEVEYSHTETVDYDGDGKFAKVYKIDTSVLKNMESFEDRYAACVGACDMTANPREMELIYSIPTSSTYNGASIPHYTKNAVFLTDEGMENKEQCNKRNEIADEFDVDSDGLTTDDTSIVAPGDGFVTGHYIISARSDISVSAGVRPSSSDGEFQSWNGSTSSYVQVQPGVEHDARFSVLNGSGNKTSGVDEPDKMTYIYIPIPKAGQQWGIANSGVAADGTALDTFAYNMVLAGAVEVPDSDVFRVSYGTVPAGFNASDNYGTVGAALKNASWGTAYSEETNCVRIAVNGMDPSDAASHIILPLVAADNAPNRAVNIFSAFYYEDITSKNGNHFSGWYPSDKIAMQIAEGELSGKIWIDANGNGIQESGELGVANATVTLSDGKTATTDTDGVYSFKKLAIGEYSVSYAYDTNTYALSAANAGGNDSTDSDAEESNGKAVISGIVIPTTDSMGKTTYNVTNMDIGLTPFVTVEYSWDGDIPTGAVKPADATMTSGTAYDAEAVAEVTGYTFDGWYTDNAYKNKFANGTAITGATTLYGKWTINKYDVTYAWSEAPDAAVLPEKDTVPYGTEFNAATPVACTGYTFDGWYTDEECTKAFANGTAITGGITLYGKWTRDTTEITGSVNWVENGEGFERPETVTVQLMLGDTVIDSVDVLVDTNESQSFAFDPQYKYSEDGTEEYEYTVKQESTPTNYVTTVSGYNITNTYNVNKYYITVEWDHTGAPADERVTEATVILNRDGEGYKTATLTEENPTATTTIARLEADGHTFSVVQNEISGYETTYGEPDPVDTDNDGIVDAVTYTVKNTYIMPKVTVSGDIKWTEVPDGETIPDITVKLMLDGKGVDTAEVTSGNAAYQFIDLDRYNADGTVAAYTVEVEAIPSYSTTYSDAETDENGNITINITNKGEFAYGTLTVSNTVIGGDDEFTFTITVGKKQETAAYALRRAGAVQYPYSGTYSGTITAGEPTEFTLKNGESITIEKILVGVNYTVTQNAHPDYYTTPASLKAEGVIAEGTNSEPFVNSKIPLGTLSITTKVTGSAADKNTVFEYKVTIDSEETFEYAIGETKGTLKSGDVLRLKHGETAVISGIKENTAYSVEQVADLGYKMTSTGASGKVTAQGITASFINTKEGKVAGDTAGPDTGDYSGNGEEIAICVMQLAMLMMIFCVWQMKRRKEEA